jgi:hypothetical protein
VCLVPFVECSRNFGNGTCVTQFGYDNNCNSTIQRLGGMQTRNHVMPHPSIRPGQPTVFALGHQSDAFTIVWRCRPPTHSQPNSLQWILDAGATVTSATVNSCQPDDDDNCTLPESAQLRLYAGENNYGASIFPNPRGNIRINEGQKVFGELIADVLPSQLDNVCLRLRKVILCAFDSDDFMVPFDPHFPSNTGCNSPGAGPDAQALLWNSQTSFSNPLYHFVIHPNNAPCDGQVSFTWVHRALARGRVFIQVEWVAQSLEEEDRQPPCDQYSGASSGCFESGCPSRTHRWDNDQQCCVQISQSVVVIVQNQFNISQNVVNGGNTNVDVQNSNNNNNSNINAEDDDDDDDDDDHHHEHSHHGHNRRGSSAVVWIALMIIPLFIVLLFLLFCCCQPAPECYAPPPPCPPGEEYLLLMEEEVPVVVAACAPTPSAPTATDVELVVGLEYDTPSVPAACPPGMLHRKPKSAPPQDVAL